MVLEDEVVDVALGERVLASGSHRHVFLESTRPARRWFSARSDLCRYILFTFDRDGYGAREILQLVNLNDERSIGSLLVFTDRCAAGVYAGGCFARVFVISL